MRRAKIVATGANVPDRVFTNHDLEALCDTSDEWIRKRTGICERRVAAEGVGPADLALPAARDALADAGLQPEDVDAIIFCTVTPDQLLPGSAHLIQGELGAGHAAAFDLNAACSGFVYGLATAQAYIATGLFDTILLIGAEVCTSLLTWEHRDTSVLFGDGAAAVVLQATEEPRGVLSAYLAADGRNQAMLSLPKGGSRARIRAENVNDDPYRIFMDGQEVYRHAVVRFREAIDIALERAGVGLDDIDLFIPHQANARIIETVGSRIGLENGRVKVNIDRYGNTVAASIPLALHEANVEGRLSDGALVLIAAFGAGLTWGAAVVRW